MFLINRLLKTLYVLLFFITPLIVLPFTSELFEFNKMIFIYLIAALAFFLWSAKSIIQKKIIVKKNPFNLILVFFFFTQVLSAIFSIDGHTSLFGYYGRLNGGLFSILAYLVLYFVFISSFEKEFVLQLLKVSLLSSFCVILWGLPGKSGHDLSCLVFAGQFSNKCWTNQFFPDVRMFSTLGQPNWLGAYLAINFFIGLYFYFKKDLKPKIKNIKNYQFPFTTSQLILFFYLILNFTTILFTRSRSAMLSVAVGLGFFFLFVISFQKNNLQKLLLLSVYLFISVLIFKTGVEKIDRFIKFPISNFQLPNKSQTINKQIPKKTAQPQFSSEVTESFDIRKIVWKGAINLGLKYPLFGTGVETFAYSYYFERPKDHNATSEWDFLYNKAHNEYLNYFATTGFLGAIAYLLIIFIFSISNIQYLISNGNSKSQITNNKLLITCLLLAYLSILITNFFGFSTTTINLFFYLIPAFFLILAYPTYEVERGPSGQAGNEAFFKKLNLKQEFSIIFIAFFTLYLLVSIGLYFFADIKYAQALNYYNNEDYQTAAALFNQALKMHYEHVYEDKLSYSLANLAFLAAYQKEKEISQKFLALSKTYNNHSLQQSPQNVLYWKTQAKNDYLYFQTTQDAKYLKEGIKTLEYAKKLSPTDPKIDYSQSIYYSLLADETKNENEKKSLEKLALKAINSSLSLKPDLTDAQEVKKQLEKKLLSQ